MKCQRQCGGGTQKNIQKFTVTVRWEYLYPVIRFVSLHNQMFSDLHCKCFWRQVWDDLTSNTSKSLSETAFVLKATEVIETLESKLPQVDIVRKYLLLLTLCFLDMAELTNRLELTSFYLDISWKTHWHPAAPLVSVANFGILVAF